MTDTIIKGTGNSRSIKSVTTLPLTWEDARALLISSGWPVDIGAINAAGCQQVGDALNKANLLKDETAALYGLGGTATPNDILAAIRPLITEAHDVVRIETGSYTGTGEDISSKTIPLGMKPNFFMLTMNKITSNNYNGFIYGIGQYLFSATFMSSGNSASFAKVGTIYDAGVKISLIGHFNRLGTVFYYIAIA